MKQAVEAQVLNPHCDLGEHGLRQILTDVIEEVRRSVQQEIDGAELLHSLLNAPWLQSLLKVYECLQKFLRDSPAPALDYASGLSFQLLIDIRSLPGCSDEAKELYRLLRQPHLQALLSAHDTVAQKDYDPVLLPLPDDLPDDEEATRIVCLVKNKQPLLCDPQTVGLPLPNASPPCGESSSGGVHSHLDTLRRLTRQRLHKSVAFRVDDRSPDANKPTWNSASRGGYPSTKPLCHPEAQPYPPPPYKPMNKGAMCCNTPLQCRVCYANSIWEQNLNRSAPAVYNSVMIDDIIKELSSGDEDTVEQSANAKSPHTHTSPTPQQWTLSQPCLTMSYYTNVEDYLQPGAFPRLRNQSPQISTAPPSPMQPRREKAVPRVAPVELAKQESLDELRSTVQLAASSMESSTKDIKELGERMAAATELMSETVQENSQALVLLMQVVDKLQMLLAAARAESITPKSTDAEEGESAPLTSMRRGQRPSLTHQSRYDFPSLDPSSSSSNSPNVSSMSTLRTKSTPSSLKKHAHVDPKPPLSNGLSDELGENLNTTRGASSNQKRKTKRKTV